MDDDRINHLHIKHGYFFNFSIKHAFTEVFATHDQSKLVAADTTVYSMLCRESLYLSGDIDKYLIAYLSSVDIIYHLKTLDIRCYDHISVIGILHKYLLDASVKIVSVIESGQAVMRSHVSFLIDTPLLLGTIFRRDK